MIEYFVEGGVYKDTTFKEMQPGTFERHGPFASYDEAKDVWKGRMFQNVDNALHRLRIVEEPA